MKKLLLIPLLFTCFVSLAQTNYFELTVDGMKSAQDTNQDFVVIPFEGISQSDLYNLFLASIGKSYVSPQDVISKVENKQISVNGIQKELVERTRHHRYDLNYTVIFEFKDGRVKIDAPHMNKMVSYASGEQIMNLQGGAEVLSNRYTAIYKKNGELRLERAKESLEVFFNNLIEEVLANVEKRTSDDDDW